MASTATLERAGSDEIHVNKLTSSLTPASAETPSRRQPSMRISSAYSSWKSQRCFHYLSLSIIVRRWMKLTSTGSILAIDKPQKPNPCQMGCMAHFTRLCNKPESICAIFLQSTNFPWIGWPQVLVVDVAKDVMWTDDMECPWMQCAKLPN